MLNDSEAEQESVSSLMGKGGGGGGGGGGIINTLHLCIYRF